MIKLLVVDDSALVRKLLGAIFQREKDFELAFARNGLEALDQIKTFAPHVVTLDVHMPQMDGLACLDRIMVERPCPVIMVSSVTAEGAEATLEALRLGAVDFVSKPKGAVSLHIEELGAQLVAKVRSAAGAKLRSSLRLKERVRHRIGAAPQKNTQTERKDSRPIEQVSGDGLVLVGTSTGGPVALEALVTTLPASFPWPILIAQHMPSNFTGALARRLDRLSELTVMEVMQPTLLQPGHAYIGRGDHDIVVSRRVAGLFVMNAPAQADYLWHPSTDRMVRSAMNYLPCSQLIGVLMTGMGSDGAKAMTELHAKGGRTIAEAEETAVVWGMPGELVKAGGADWTLPLQLISQHLQKLMP